MRLFILTEHCKSRAHCGTCRNLEGGRKWRADASKRYALPENNNVDFQCPHGVEWGYKPIKQAVSAPQPQQRAMIAPKVQTATPPVETKTSGCGCSRKKANV